MKKMKSNLLLRAALGAACASFVATAATAQTTPDPTVDSDGDGVDDAADAQPCNPRVSARVYAPADRTYGMLLFEDKWPAKGDFDFNDAVVAYNQVLRYDSSAQLTGFRMDLSVLAVGARFANGLALRIPGVPHDGIASLTFRVTNVATGALQQVNLQPGQTLQGDVILVLADDLHALFGVEASRAWVNTDSVLPAMPYVDMELDVELTSGQTVSAADAPFDVFLFDYSRGVEVHRPRYQGTAQMDASLYNTLDDGSTATRAFVTSAGIPFALEIPELADYPLEGVAVDQLYPQVVQFGASSGTQATQFYRTPTPGQAFGLVPPRKLSAAAAPDVSCFAPAPGVCGGATATGHVSAPTSGLCGFGGASTVSTSGGQWRWTCAGVYSTPTSCTAPDWVCQPNIASTCSVSGGTGSQTCNGSGTGYGTCTVTSCNSGFYQSGNACLAQVCSPGSTTSCAIANGTGVNTCNNIGSGYGGCTVASCNSGYQRSGNACIPLAPTTGNLSPGNTTTIATSGRWSIRCLAWSGRTCTHFQQRVDCSSCGTYSLCGQWHDVTTFNNGSNRTPLNLCAIATGSSAINSVGATGTAAYPQACGWSASNHPICESSRASYYTAGAGISSTLGLLLNPSYCGNHSTLITVDCAGW